MAYRLSDNQACKWLHFKISSKQDDGNYMNEIRSYPNECSIILWLIYTCKKQEYVSSVASKSVLS
jgi:hypothetical protein